jgi:hypothetical protein
MSLPSEIVRAYDAVLRGEPPARRAFSLGRSSFIPTDQIINQPS